VDVDFDCGETMPTKRCQDINQKAVWVASGIEADINAICRILNHAGYRCIGVSTLPVLEMALRDPEGIAVLLDLDTLGLTNLIIRNLSAQHPHLCFLGTSAKRLHPDLKEAILDHIFACLAKPVDPDELLYWIKCIDEKEAERKAPPRTRES